VFNLVSLLNVICSSTYPSSGFFYFDYDEDKFANKPTLPTLLRKTLDPYDTYILSPNRVK